MKNRGAGARLGGKGGAVDFGFEESWLVLCMLYLSLNSSFLMTLFLQQNVQKAKSCPGWKKEVLRVAQE